MGHFKAEKQKKITESNLWDILKEQMKSYFPSGIENIVILFV